MLCAEWNRAEQRQKLDTTLASPARTVRPSPGCRRSILWTVNGPHAVVIVPAITRIEMLRIARTYEPASTRHRPVAVEVGHLAEAPSRAEELFRGAQGASGAGTLGQRQGFERLRATAILHPFWRGNRTASRICRRGKGRYRWIDMLELRASTLLPISFAAAASVERRRRFPRPSTISSRSMARSSLLKVLMEFLRMCRRRQREVNGPAELDRSMHMRKLILGLLELLITASLFLFRLGAAAMPAHHDGMPNGQQRKGQTVPWSSAGQLLVVNRALTTLPGLSDRAFCTVQPAGKSTS